MSSKKQNIMSQPFIEKIVLSAGGTADNLAKAKKLLEFLTKRKAQVVQSSKRIPDFGVRPGLEVGTRVTLRGRAGVEMLKRLLGAIDNTLSKKQIAPNHFSFGIEEYIEIPGAEYQREIGIRGFNTTVVFARKGLRIVRKKIKSSSVPKKQIVSKEDVIQFMESNFKTKFK